MSTATQPTLDQKRAADALQKIRSLAATNKAGHYVSYVSSLPATIVMNGLGQALATLLAKAGRKKDPKRDPHYFLYDHVASWLAAQLPELGGDTDGLIDRLMENGQDVYVHSQAEAMAYLNWLKQFARAYLHEPEGQPDE